MFEMVVSLCVMWPIISQLGRQRGQVVCVGMSEGGTKHVFVYIFLYIYIYIYNHSTNTYELALIFLKHMENEHI